MNRGEFDNIREKLYDLQMPVEAGVWDDIAGTLRRRRRARLLYWASSAAAVIIAALFVFFPSSGEEESLVAVVQEVENTASVAQKEITQEGAATEEKVVEKGKVVEKDALVADKATEKVAAAEDNAVKDGTAKENAVKDGTAKDNAVKEEKRADAGNLYADEFERYIAQSEVKSERKYTLALSSGVMPGSSASVAGSIIKATSAGAGSISQSHLIEQISDTRYSLPLNLGVQFQIPLKNNMALGAGVNYTMLRSSYDCLINKKKFNVKQTLHYIGIPVNVYGLVVDRNNFSFYVNAGGTLEKGIRAVYHLNSYDSSEQNSSSIDGMLFSIHGGLGVEYRFNNTLGLYLEPNIVYYFNSDTPRSIRTDQPLQVKAELGFRFRF